MAKETKISWCDSTFNPFIGCTKIGPGCDHCYAEVQDSRKRWGGTTHWGAGVARYRTSASNWAQPLKWNKAAAASGKVHRVFCASLADFADNDVDPDWQRDLARLIAQTPSLFWLLCTKRIGNVPALYRQWMREGFPPNVRILITICNQEEADRDIPKLLALPCKNGISYEPALGPVDWSRWLGSQCDRGSVPGPHGFGGVTCPRCGGNRALDGCGGLEWIIVGGESAQGGHQARPFDIAWARDTITQCKAAGVPVFVKQLGSLVYGPVIGPRVTDPTTESFRVGRTKEGNQFPYGPIFKDRAGADPTEWPEDLRVREFPEG